jgi:hypothetical protein
MRIYRIVLLSILVLSVPSLQASEGSEHTAPKIIMAICDKVGLPAETLRAAQKHAKKIFAYAGVDLIWIDSEGNHAPMTFSPDSLEGCGLPSVDTDFFAVISKESPRGWLSDGLGFSIPQSSPPRRLYVLYDPVRTMLTRMPTADSAIIIGHVVAHELGHLLLGDHQHTPSGLMSTKWQYGHIIEAAQGFLQFHPTDAKRIHSEAQAISVQSASRPAEASVLTSASNSTETDK